MINGKKELKKHFGIICNKIKEGRDISWDVRIIAHLILDHTAFTHSYSNEYKKNSDDKIDFYAEFVPNKDKFNMIVKKISNKEYIYNKMISTMKVIKDLYSDKFKKSWLRFLLSGSFRNFVRCCVKCAVEYTVAYVILSKESANVS